MVSGLLASTGALQVNANRCWCSFSMVRADLTESQGQVVQWLTCFMLNVCESASIILMSANNEDDARTPFTTRLASHTS